MTIYQLKPAFQDLLRPLTRRLAAAGVTANQVTVAAALSSVVLGASLALAGDPRVFLLLPAFLLVRMALNAIDGMLAREHGMQSPLGALLNELGDALSDCALYLPFALVSEVTAIAAIQVVLLAMLSEMAGVVALQIGASRRYDGPMGKSDRAFVLGVLGLLLGVGVAPGTWMATLLYVVAALLVLTVWNRARRALAEVAP